MPSKYIYEALGAPDSEVRLLELLPGTDKEQVQCRLSASPLSNTPTYEPLSYSWGSEENPKEILLNGQPFSVTLNLAAALRQLRYLKTSRLLWADAICINQRDNYEKSMQIPLMRTIYQRGEQTIVWLGEEDRQTSHAFAMLETMATYVDAVPKENWVRLNPDKWKLLRNAMGRKSARDIEKHDVSPIVYNPAYWIRKRRSSHARVSVFGRMWFSRVWVVQEVAVSPRVVVLCGGYSTGWDTLEKAYRMSELWELWEDGQHLRTLIEMRTSIQSGISEELGTVMSKISSCQATKALDRIYAILGLADRLPPGLEIAIDYNADINTKFVEATRACLTISGTAQLALAGHGNPQCLPKDVDGSTLLPSWSWSPQPDPDQPTYQWQFHTAAAEKCKFQAAGKKANKGQPSVSFSNDSHLLFVRGIILDEIVEVGPVFGSLQLGYKVQFHSSRFRIGDVQLPYHYSGSLYRSKRVADPLSPDTYPGKNETRRQAWISFLTGIIMMKDGMTDEEKIRKAIRYEENLTRPFHILGRGPGELPWSKDVPLHDPELPHSINEGLHSFDTLSTLLEYMAKRRVVRTSHGYIGLCDRYTEVGDRLALIEGICVPAVLRPASGDQWRLVGESFVYGAMHGELWSAEKAGDLCLE